MNTIGKEILQDMQELLGRPVLTAEEQSVIQVLIDERIKLEYKAKYGKSLKFLRKQNTILKDRIIMELYSGTDYIEEEYED